jgi:hypothetical protein
MPREAKLFWCGWPEFNPFLKAVFSDFTFVDSRYGGKSETSGPDDILAISQGSRTIGDAFQGNVSLSGPPRISFATNLSSRGQTLYIDGEDGQVQISKQEDIPKLHYLGIDRQPTAPVKAWMWMPYMILEIVANANMKSGNELAVLDRAAAALPAKSRESAPDKFLVYMNSNCKPHRENFYDELYDAALAAGVSLPVAAGKCHGSKPATADYKNDRGNRFNTAIDHLAPYRCAKGASEERERRARAKSASERDSLANRMPVPLLARAKKARSTARSRKEGSFHCSLAQRRLVPRLAH